MADGRRAFIKLVTLKGYAGEYLGVIFVRTEHILCGDCGQNRATIGSWSGSPSYCVECMRRKLQRIFRFASWRAEIRETIFALLVRKMYGSGGDGSATLVCSNYHQAADLFEDYIAESDDPHLKNFTRKQYEEHINFAEGADGQEAIIFTSQLPKSHDFDFAIMLAHPF